MDIFNNITLNEFSMHWLVPSWPLAICSTCFNILRGLNDSQPSLDIVKCVWGRMGLWCQPLLTSSSFIPSLETSSLTGTGLCVGAWPCVSPCGRITFLSRWVCNGNNSHSFQKVRSCLDFSHRSWDVLYAVCASAISSKEGKLYKGG